MDGEVHLVVVAQSIDHEDILIVGGLIEAGGVGPTVLVIPAGDFKRLADLTSDEGRPIYSMEFGMRPRSDSRWLPWLVPAERLAERFGVTVQRGEVAGRELPPAWRNSFGFLGESEVMRRLAEADDLNLFRAFPDSETAEIAALHLDTQRVIGLQVKTVDIDQTRLRATVNVLASSFLPAPTTYLVILAWLRDEARFHESCLLIPSDELLNFAHNDGYGHITFEFHPDSPAQAPQDAYRHELSAMQDAIKTLLLTYS
jgi:hypothetical protein